MRRTHALSEIEVAFWLAPERRGAFEPERAAALGAAPIGSRRYLSRRELRLTGDADPALFGQIETHLRAAGVAHVERAWRRLEARGSRAACTEAVRAVRGSASAAGVRAVLGLDDTVAPQSYARASSRAPASGFAPLDIARAYRAPVGLQGSGAIGIVYFTGTFYPGDLERAQAAAGRPVPAVALRGRAGTRSTREEDYEIALDSQMAAALAPGARLVLYRGENDAAGYARAVATALLDEEHAPAVISISYGVPEAAWPPEALRVIDELFVAAALCGVTVVAASGDHGGDAEHGAPNVIYPASSAFVLACGGTKLRLERSRRLSEVVWNEPGHASGGGYSRHFGPSAWQAAGRRGRGVPDVAGHADSGSGYRVFVRGDVVLVGGTSAVAPLWAGFIALVNERLGRTCGFFTPLLYACRTPDLFYDVTSGSNGRYTARAGWDPCTGLGSPHFGALLQFFASAA